MNLKARPGTAACRGLTSGTARVPLTNGRTALLHVPPRPVTGLVIALHGAGGQGRAAMDLLRPDADRVGLAVLAPSSAGSTWAALFGGADPDTPAIDAALEDVFALHPFDPDRIAVAGFSDGATYALSLGLTNGDLLRRVVAFSPGFQNARERSGRPAFFLTHGTRDQVLPIERTSRRIVPALQQAGYEVTYHEFDDGHIVPPRYVTEAADWLLG
jgi:phospholipase/carboxylesterase